MPLDKYPFSEKFGWVNDKFGVSWQVMRGEAKQKITPFLLFVGEQHGRAEEAVKFYVGLFKDSKVIHVEHHGAGEGETEGTVKHARFSLQGEEFMAMDSGLDHKFSFTPAISFLVNCASQAEVDRLWEKLSDGGSKEACGWVQDRFGVSWQVVPTVLGEMMSDADPVKVERVMQAMLKMKKLDIAALERAYAKT